MLLTPACNVGWDSQIFISERIRFDKVFKASGSNSLLRKILYFFAQVYTNLAKSKQAGASGNFIGMDADESYMDVLMRFPEAPACFGSRYDSNFF